MNAPNVRKEVEQLKALGPFPAEGAMAPQKVLEYERLLRAITRPVTDEEARAMTQLFGRDGAFGLASFMLHLIETSPGWPLEDCLSDSNNEWIVELRNRAIRGGQM